MDKLGLLGIIGLNGGGDGPTPEPIPPIPEDEWIRPSYWPDLSGLNFETENDFEVYFIVDKSVANQNGTITFTLKYSGGNPYYLQRGNIVNNEFVPYETTEYSAGGSGTTYTVNISDWGHLTVCKLYCQTLYYSISSSDSIKFAKTSSSGKTNPDPIVEMYINSKNRSICQLGGTAIQHLVIKNSPPDFRGMCEYMMRLRKVDIDYIPNGDIDMQQMFYYCYNLQRINLSNFAGVPIKSLDYTFEHCYNLKKIIGFENLNVSKVTSMFSTFGYCYSLQEIDLTPWNTSNVTAFYNTFTDCISLKKLNLNGKITSKTTTLDFLCSSDSCLQEVDMRNCDLSSVTSLNRTFFKCTQLREVKGANNFNTSSNTSLNGLFWDCYSIENLDFINNWDKTTVTDMNDIWTNCNSVRTLDMSNYTKVSTSSSFLPPYVVDVKFPYMSFDMIDSVANDGFKRTLLSRKSIMDFISKAEDNSEGTTRSITFNKTPILWDVLSKEDIAQFTSKGYSVAFY